MQSGSFSLLYHNFIDFGTYFIPNSQLILILLENSSSLSKLSSSDYVLNWELLESNIIQIQLTERHILCLCYENRSGSIDCKSSILNSSLGSSLTNAFVEQIDLLLDNGDLFEKKVLIVSLFSDSHI